MNVEEGWLKDRKCQWKSLEHKIKTRKSDQYKPNIDGYLAKEYIQEDWNSRTNWLRLIIYIKRTNIKYLKYAKRKKMLDLNSDYYIISFWIIMEKKAFLKFKFFLIHKLSKNM
jgi:hypothetical protein